MISRNARHKSAQLGASRKRKEREGLGADAHPPHAAAKAEPAAPPASAGSNTLLAGYLAQEFLTKGTLLGERWREPKGPARHQREVREPIGQKKQTAPAAYAEVSHLLKTDGARVPGVVNPTQLARWLLS